MTHRARAPGRLDHPRLVQQPPPTESGSPADPRAPPERADPWAHRGPNAVLGDPFAQVARSHRARNARGCAFPFGGHTIWGSRGRRFKSCQPDRSPLTCSCRSGAFCVCPRVHHVARWRGHGPIRGSRGRNASAPAVKVGDPGAGSLRHGGGQCDRCSRAGMRHPKCASSVVSTLSDRTTLLTGSGSAVIRYG